MQIEQLGYHLGVGLCTESLSCSLKLGTQLRMMPMPGDKLAKPPRIEVVTTFFGGQGTINVNSWSPDSKRFAYVTYEALGR